MKRKRKLPTREQVFIMSLMYHGFRPTTRRQNLKRQYGYVIPATDREDAEGIDLWVKMPRDSRVFPVQVSQRGTKLYRKHHFPKVARAIQHAPERSNELLHHFNAAVQQYDRERQHKIRSKQRMCFKAGIAFALVRDFDGQITNKNIAWGDVKALRHGIAHLRRWM
jgi:hypothetical protein